MNERFDVIVTILELIGTAAFAASGALTAIKRRFDLFGVIIIGVTTAVGGGKNSRHIMHHLSIMMTRKLQFVSRIAQKLCFSF